MSPSDTDDDGFGPAVTGGGTSTTSAAPPSPARPDDGFGPAQRGKATRRKSPRRWIWRSLLVLGLLVFGFVVALVVVANSRLTRVPVDTLASAEPMNILVVGSDSREGLTKRERKELGTGSVEGARTDTIMLLQVAGGQAAMLSFPRDLVVERCDGSTGRINVAYSQSRACLVETVANTSGIPITHYLEVDFLGFRDIVAAVGGVEICLKDPISDKDAHIDLPAGCQRLSPPDALGYVRVRKIDDDIHRVGRQQQFLKELAAEVVKPSTLFNPVRLLSTTSAVAGSLTVNKGFGPLDLAKLGWAGRDIASGDYPSLAVPAEPSTLGGASVLVATEQADAVYRAFRNGTITQKGRKVRPEDVSVNVRNGAGVSGLAATAADALRAAGFHVGGVGNTRAVDRTVIRYRKGHEQEAAVLASSMPIDVPLEVANNGSPVVLVLGPDVELPRR